MCKFYKFYICAVVGKIIEWLNNMQVISTKIKNTFIHFFIYNVTNCWGHLFSEFSPVFVLLPLLIQAIYSCWGKQYFYLTSFLSVVSLVIPFVVSNVPLEWVLMSNIKCVKETRLCMCWKHLLSHCRTTFLFYWKARQLRISTFAVIFLTG